jgi:hypothetical protein
MIPKVFNKRPLDSNPFRLSRDASEQVISAMVRSHNLLGDLIEAVLSHDSEKLPIEKLMLIVDESSVEIEDNKRREKGHTGLASKRLWLWPGERDR